MVTKAIAYDLVIVGSGTAAMTAAMRVRKAGWTVAMIDFRPFGGTCALRGCDPKRMLGAASEALNFAALMKGQGVLGDLAIDWSALMAFKRSFTDSVPQSTLKRLAENAIDSFHGTAHFIDEHRLDVDGTVVAGKHFLIATGAEPVALNIPGEDLLVTHEEFLELPHLPGRIVFVGGGYIAAEFSHIAARAGAQVSIVHRGKQMLDRFEPEPVGWLMEKFAELGISVHTDTAVQGIEKASSGLVVRSVRDGRAVDMEADLVVHAAGRMPAIRDLKVENAGIRVEEGRVVLNEFLQSVSQPRVYAAGDSAEVGPPLTPVSSRDATVVATNLLSGNSMKPNYEGVPSVVFTAPPLASVGLTEAKAKEQGLHFRINSRKASDWFTARRVAEPVYGFKVLIEEDTDRILGAHLVGPGVDEVINLFALAIRNHLTSQAVADTVFAYPTGASDVSYML